MINCPHCGNLYLSSGVILIDCYIVKTFEYLVCSRCAVQYMQIDPVNFDIVFKDSPSLYKKILCEVANRN